jgi:hypothetical protein
MLIIKVRALLQALAITAGRRLKEMGNAFPFAESQMSFWGNSLYSGKLCLFGVTSNAMEDPQYGK